MTNHKHYPISLPIPNLVLNVQNLVYTLALPNVACKNQIFHMFLFHLPKMSMFLVGFPNSMYPHVGPHTPYFGYGYGGIGNVPIMWPLMSDPLFNPMTSPKPIWEIAQIGIIIDLGEPSHEDEDYFERKHNPRMPQIVSTRKSCHG
jgi:hypothetical protein